jgi:hypothetical protein
MKYTVLYYGDVGEETSSDSERGAIGCDLASSLVEASVRPFCLSLWKGLRLPVDFFYGPRMIRRSRDAAGTQKNVVGRREESVCSLLRNDSHPRNAKPPSGSGLVVDQPDGDLFLDKQRP